MKIRICVSTCKKYSQKTIPVLTSSLREAGFPLEDVLVVDGGYTHDRSLKLEGIDTLEVSHNSFDFTALIAVTEKRIESDFWLLLHDTCRVGPKFCSLLHAADFSYKKIALKPFPSMSIGLYSFDYLLQHTERIIREKNTDYSEEGLIKAKHTAIGHEDLLLWKTNDLPCGTFNKVGERDRITQSVDSGWYTTATDRIQEYYPQLDLFKLKGNWGQASSGSQLVVNI